MGYKTDQIVQSVTGHDGNSGSAPEGAFVVVRKAQPCENANYCSKAGAAGLECNGQALNIFTIDSDDSDAHW